MGGAGDGPDEAVRPGLEHPVALLEDGGERVDEVAADADHVVHFAEVRVGAGARLRASLPRPLALAAPFAGGVAGRPAEAGSLYPVGAVRVAVRGEALLPGPHVAVLELAGLLASVAGGPNARGESAYVAVLLAGAPPLHLHAAGLGGLLPEGVELLPHELDARGRVGHEGVEGVGRERVKHVERIAQNETDGVFHRVSPSEHGG